jgi:predicted AAA+ superfamily ATPase
MVDLADEREHLRFARNPGELFQRIESTQPRVVLLDEVQRIPSLLNSLQSIIDTNKNIRFLL